VTLSDLEELRVTSTICNFSECRTSKNVAHIS